MNRNRFSRTFNYPTLWGFETESNMYEWIWNSRPHVSFISGLPLPEPPQPHNFLHLLEKGLAKYPLFRLNPDCVILGTYREHFLLDQGSDSQRIAYAKEVPTADWEAVEIKKDMLVKTYEDMFSHRKKT